MGSVGAVSARYLMDMSAWARLQHPRLATSRSEHVARAMIEGRVHSCPPFLLELGCSARNHPDYAGLMTLVHDAMPCVPLTELAVHDALRMQEQLAMSSHHRVQPNDLLMAAIAIENDLTVLHVDKHYPIIAERAAADLRVEWLAPPTSLA